MNQNKAKIAKLESQQVTNDFYYTNQETIEMAKNTTKTLQTWTVKEGETINFEVKFDTDQAAKQNNAVWLMLYENDRLVARSNDDGNGRDDNVIVTLNYRGKSLGGDVEYRLDAKPSGYYH